MRAGLRDVSGEPGRRPTVLVLGVGGNVSQGILKALALSTLSPRVVAACVSPLSVGLYRADVSLVGPPAGEPEFLPWLRDICREEGVDAVMSGVEPVLTAVSAYAPELARDTGAITIVSPPEKLRIGQDKLLTKDWLEEHGLPFPRSADASDQPAVAELVERFGYPLIVKPRTGKGGEGVVHARSPDDLAPVLGREGYVVQELLGGEEYTVGCLCDREGEVRGVLALRRSLSAGTTYRAEAGDFPDVRRLATAIARALAPTGPLNVQLRLTERGPVPFELNIRFSGTTPVRARLGFNEVEAALRHYLLGEPVAMPDVTRGVALRYWNEMYVSPESAESLERTGRLDDPWDEDVIVEDWGFSG